jgi:7,8-dihydropterin-6-yl-methyl-4-(beta-D-ribofuranosyl)aminobenzene 5'-phosphate synthase
MTPLNNSGIFMFSDNLKSIGQIRKFRDVQLTVLYDSVSMDHDMKTGIGFSCFVQVGNTKILFDTGGDGLTLLENMNKLGLDPRSIQLLLISHSRLGNIGGLEDFLNVNRDVSVYIPDKFPALLAENIELFTKKVHHVLSVEELYPNVFSLGEFLGIFREQAMAVRSSKGIIIIVGCAHHSSEAILQRTKEAFPEESIFMVVGGFHFSGLNETEKNKILKIFRKYKVRYVGACFCCEEAGRKILQRDYDKNYIPLGAGGTITINANQISGA